ncbi:MAG: hypothetical protein V4714_05835, partial [Bacteroidota bacterium]
ADSKARHQRRSAAHCADRTGQAPTLRNSQQESMQTSCWLSHSTQLGFLAIPISFIVYYKEDIA